jgi:SpoVK/Ycf46/Vps4 family AAA+-type ATPase
MEDMEELMSREHQSEILQLLDGGEKIDNVVFLATSNNPEKLGARIVNRPSRFDRRFKIGMPCAESRKLFLEYLDQDNKVDIKRWVKDTEGLSMAHLKELFIATQILGDDYETSLATIQSMKEKIEGEPEFNERKIGLGNC